MPPLMVVRPQRYRRRRPIASGCYNGTARGWIRYNVNCIRLGWQRKLRTIRQTGSRALPPSQGNAAMLAAVQAGTSAKPVIRFVDSGYAISGGILSNTSASGISSVMVSDPQDSITYIPTHANIKALSRTGYKGNAQDTTSGPRTTRRALSAVSTGSPRELAHRLKRGTVSSQLRDQRCKLNHY